MPNSIELPAEDRRLQFVNVELIFLAHGMTNIFATKNNKTLGETLEHKRYKALADYSRKGYGQFLAMPLGSFLEELKSRDDSFYKRFLNPHGDERYCHFRMVDCAEKRLKGLYLYALEQSVVYIGRSFDPFGKRVDQGYGKIHPKNCFLDGQSTNCHLNSLIESRSSNIRFYVCSLRDNAEIERLERTLIQQRKPEWNVALTK